MPLISLIHPSRGRAQKSALNSLEWINKAGCDVELIVSIDRDDPQHEFYYRTYSQEWLLNPNANPKHVIISNDNKSLVEATNRAAEVATGDILLYLSDDFKCPDNWGHLIEQELDTTKPMLLKVDDCLQKFHVPVLTIPIMTKVLHKLLGYFFHWDFKSMHCDEHLYQRCARLGVLKFAPHLKFPHDHVSIGKSPDDDTYRRSAGNWNHGVMMMNKHRRLGFTE